MKIVKYLLLLLVLLSVGGSVFIATQKSDYTLIKSIVIKTPISSVYNYLNDNKNYKDWYVLNSDNSTIELEYSKNSSGVGSYYSWSGSEGDGKTTVFYSKENDSIVQKIEIDGALSEVVWKLKDTTGGTKVSYTSKGEMSFSNKLHAFLNGGVSKVIGKKIELSLKNLDRNLDYELNTYSVTSNGVVFKKGCYYLKQTINTKLSRLNYNVKILIPYLINFSNQNKITITGKPFIIYNSIDESKETTNISICLPIKRRIFTSSGSDIICNELEGFTAFKTTLSGDYSHRKTAWKKTKVFINKNNETLDKTISVLEVYDKSYIDGVSPSKWQTIIYTAVKNKKNTFPTTASSTIDSLETTELE
jgi:effector-binding domain-containing protein